MRAQAQDGEIALAYFDEVGFAQVHPNRSAWTVCGEQHRIEAPRGERLNVMAALFSPDISRLPRKSAGRAMRDGLTCRRVTEVIADRA